MAIVGVSKPYYALYNNTESTVTYEQGGVLGKATQVDITINTSEDNNLYADNGLAETDRAFTSGTFTVGTDDLSQEASKAILGVVEKALEEIDGVTDKDVKELVYDDSMTTPYLGVGIIIKKQRQNQTAWRAVVLTKVMFSVPNDAATTQGQQIEWQTPSLTAAIARDDTESHMWKREATFTTEAQAEVYIKNRLGITDVAPATYSATRMAAARKLV